jgi:hypothetical protein
MITVLRHALFQQFDAALRDASFIAKSGQIVDATIVAAPKQRNTNDEKRAIKEGRISETAPSEVSKDLSFSRQGRLQRRPRISSAFLQMRDRVPQFADLLELPRLQSHLGAVL